MITPRDYLGIFIEHGGDRKWFLTTGDTVSLLDEMPPQLAGASGEFIPYTADDPRAYHGITIPEDPNNPTYPPIPEYAYFLKHHIQTDNMTQYLLDDGLPQSYIDELFAAHPELKEQKADGISGQQSATPTFVFVRGALENEALDGKNVPAANVPFCIYDVELSTKSHTLLNYGGSPVCGNTNEKGSFARIVPQSDPNDDTNVDIQVVYTLDGRFSNVIDTKNVTYTLDLMHNRYFKSAY